MLQRQLQSGRGQRLAAAMRPEPFAELPKELLQTLSCGQTRELRDSRYMIENVVAKNFSYASRETVIGI